MGAVKEYERKKKALDEELYKYQQAYDILMDVWDKLPDREKRITHFRLKGIGL